MKKVFIRPQAYLDIEDQAVFIAKDNISAAYRLYQACQETFKKLAKMPQMGQQYLTQKKELKGVRVLPVLGFKNHLIFVVLIRLSSPSN